MKDIAQKYKNKCLSCLPTKQDKSPDITKWLGVEIEPSSFEKAYGIGIKCGKESHGLECMDFDNHFGDAKEIISQYLAIDEVKEIYDKYKLPIESTVSGGFHLLFRCDKNEGNRKLASRPKLDEKTNKWKPDCIIETRGEGGYFVAAPTHGYRIVRNNILAINHITEEERDILISNAISFNKWTEPVKNKFEHTDRPGDRYNNDPNAIEDARTELLNKGWKEIRKGVFQRPGKSKGISATLGHIENIFYVFSSNAYPFEPMKGYTPFQVVSILKYNQNFSDFAKDLSERYGMNEKSDYTKKSERKQPVKSDLDWAEMLKKSYIDLKIPVEKPPIIMRIGDTVNGINYQKRLLTLGNFSAITGKAKSKKTMLSILMTAALVRNSQIENKLFASLPNNKRWIFRFDTEQSEYDAYVASKITEKVIGFECDYFGTYDLRDLTAHERCGVIDFAIKKFHQNIGVVIIDGIADLATKLNDEEEAGRVVSLLMRWTKQYKIHIINIIHQNKNDNFATGWVGSQVIKKAEVIISVEASESNDFRSTVRCDNIRGAAKFKDFDIEVNETGIPSLIYNELFNETKTLTCNF